MFTFLNFSSFSFLLPDHFNILSFLLISSISSSLILIEPVRFLVMLKDSGCAFAITSYGSIFFVSVCYSFHFILLVSLYFWETSPLKFKLRNPFLSPSLSFFSIKSSWSSYMNCGRDAYINIQKSFLYSYFSMIIWSITEALLDMAHLPIVCTSISVLSLKINSTSFSFISTKTIFVRFTNKFCTAKSNGQFSLLVIFKLSIATSLVPKLSVPLHTTLVGGSLFCSLFSLFYSSSH